MSSSDEEDEFTGGEQRGGCGAERSLFIFSSRAFSRVPPVSSSGSDSVPSEDEQDERRRYPMRGRGVS